MALKFLCRGSYFFRSQLLLNFEKLCEHFSYHCWVSNLESMKCISRTLNIALFLLLSLVETLKFKSFYIFTYTQWPFSNKDRFFIQFYKYQVLYLLCIRKNFQLIKLLLSWIVFVSYRNGDPIVVGINKIVQPNH